MGRETYFPHLAILVPKRQSCACLRGQYTLRKITRHSNQVPRLNLRSARGTAGAPLPAISCLGAFWTPAATARGRVRHAGVQKPAQQETHALHQKSGGVAPFKAKAPHRRGIPVFRVVQSLVAATLRERGRSLTVLRRVLRQGARASRRVREERLRRDQGVTRRET